MDLYGQGIRPMTPDWQMGMHPMDLLAQLFANPEGEEALGPAGMWGRRKGVQDLVNRGPLPAPRIDQIGGWSRRNTAEL